MNRLLVMCCALAWLAGCGTKTVEMEQPQDKSSHSAMNSLDYFGEYQLDGRAGGRDVRLLELFPDGVYNLYTAEGETEAGLYRWDVTGSVISIDRTDESVLQLFVGEGFIKIVSSGSEEGRVLKLIRASRF